MVFDNQTININLDKLNETERHVYLKRELSVALATIKAVYEKEVTKLGYNNLCKIAIYHLIETLEGLTDEEAIEFLNSQHKEVVLL